MKYLLPIALALGLFTLAQAQFLPNPQLCNATQVEGSANGEVAERGSFSLALDVTCDPEEADIAFPQGTLSLDIDLNDPHFRGTLNATLIEGVRTIGRNSPTVYLSGRCEVRGVVGCRFWLSVADNDHLDEGDSPDVVSFLVLDANGNEIAYLAAPVRASSLSVQAASQ